MTTPAHIVYENLPIIHRPDWRAKAKRNMVIPEEKLKLPVMYLLLDHTGTDTCTDLDACEKKVRELQQISFQDKKLNDIQYNWVIGGDGNVFEGRGWHWRPPLNPDAPEYFDQSMEILFVGNYENEPIPSNVMESYSNVIKMFWDKGVLHRESKVHFLKTFQDSATWPKNP